MEGVEPALELLAIEILFEVGDEVLHEVSVAWAGRWYNYGAQIISQTGESIEKVHSRIDSGGNLNNDWRNCPIFIWGWHRDYRCLRNLSGDTDRKGD